MEGGDQNAQDADIMPQALDILAGLTSLGISSGLRDKVQAALSELTQHAQLAPGSGAEGAARSGSQASPSGRSHSQNAEIAALSEQLKGAEQKLGMSRSIMRKLYYKNVELEKELLLAKVRYAV